MDAARLSPEAVALLECFEALTDWEDRANVLEHARRLLEYQTAREEHEKEKEENPELPFRL